MKRKEWKKQLLAGMAAISVMLGGMLGAGTSFKVQAAEAPVITNLQVTVSEDGTQLAAWCDYQNYDEQSGCVMTLYLYRVGDGSESFIAAYRKLSYAGEGRESAVSSDVTEGVYLASVGMDYGGRVVQINSEHYYRVIQSGNKVEAVEIPEKETEGTSEKESHRGSDACIHDFDYEIIRPATPEEDAIMALQCSICGALSEETEVPNSAYAAFQKEAIEVILNTHTDEAIISTKRWVSFHQSVLEAIARRPDVTVIIQYQYQGELYEVRIPAGTDVSLLADEGGFCGFRYLNQIFDETSL